MEIRIDGDRDPGQCVSEDVWESEEITLINLWGTDRNGLPHFSPLTGLQESPSLCVKGPTLWLNCWPSASSE